MRLADRRASAFDGAVDYKARRRAPRRCAPPARTAIDVYFDNVGGDIFEAALFNMANHGRIVCCGAVSQYDDAPPAHGPRGVPGLIVTKRLKVDGFVVMDFYADKEAALAELHAWVEAGKIKVQEDVIDGLENLPAALIGLLAGENRGKRMVRVWRRPSALGAPAATPRPERRSSNTDAWRGLDRPGNLRAPPHGRRSPAGSVPITPERVLAATGRRVRRGGQT